MTDFSFRKEERLKSRKVIEQMFKTGKSLLAYPLRLVWLPMAEQQGTAPVQFTVSVSKKIFRKAHDRNRIRRQVREAWRLHKHLLYEQLGTEAGLLQQYAFMVMYIAKEPLPHTDIHKATRKMIRKWLENKDL